MLSVPRLLSGNTVNILQRCCVHHHKERQDLERFIGLRRSNTAKANRNTHHNEKMFRKLRAHKTLAMDLPDDVEIRKREKMSPSELRLEFLRRGINPFKDVQARQWTEHQSTFQSFYGIIDPYVPNKHVIRQIEPTSKQSLVDKTKEVVSHRWHTFNGNRRIRKKEGMEKFDAKAFGPTAEDIYVNAHKALVARNKTELNTFITEHAFAKMWPDVAQGSVFWELVRFNEPSIVVSTRCADNPHKSGNDIAQLIVRINSTQKLAVYDSFGKLLLGSETDEKDTIEFVVFENHVSSFDGRWRLHDKVYPQGIAPKEAPIDASLIADAPEDELLRPTDSKPIKLRMNERIKEGLKDTKKED
uniref:Large ribosomal subunit protein mL45 n=1 Tax=Panagrellus redivivus TaxID=6233 RepID=A0A7E4W095_PANRE